MSDLTWNFVVISPIFPLSRCCRRLISAFWTCLFLERMKRHSSHISHAVSFSLRCQISWFEGRNILSWSLLVFCVKMRQTDTLRICNICFHFLFPQEKKHCEKCVFQLLLFLLFHSNRLTSSICLSGGCKFAFCIRTHVNLVPDASGMMILCVNTHDVIVLL